MVHDGLWDIYNDYHMGMTGENVAEKYCITREEQDAYALNSHRKSCGRVEGWPLCSRRSFPSKFRAKKKGGEPTHLRMTKSVREDTTVGSAAKLEARIQERWNRDRRQRTRCERWRGGCWS